MSAEPSIVATAATAAVAPKPKRAIPRRKEEDVVVLPPLQEEKKEEVVIPAASSASAAPAEPQKQPSMRMLSSATRMSDNFVFIESIYRSRMTLLDLLEARGYDVAIYRKFSPAEATAAVSAFTALSFTVTKRDHPDQKCEIRYSEMARQKLEELFDSVSDEEAETTEFVIMQKGSVTDAHHKMALKEYIKPRANQEDSASKQRRKLRVSFFAIDKLVINPLHHVLVPKHELVPPAEHQALLESLYVISKSKLPEIKYHIDPIMRCIGGVPGDIVKITRPSISAGESVFYRVCAP